jgi:uncharacterized surface protein with fasciclin (FAS1) repeats
MQTLEVKFPKASGGRMKNLSIGIIVVLSGLAIAHAQEAVGSEDVLTAAGPDRSIGMFVDAVRSSAMAKMLREEGPFTLFAVRNQGFANLRKEDRETLMTNRGAMSFLLMHYVVRGNVNVDEVSSPESARTLDGMKLRVDAKTGGTYVNGSKLEQETIHCENGTIYVLGHFDPGWVHDAVAIARTRVASSVAARNSRP